MIIEIEQKIPLLRRTQESLDSLWEWLENCDPETDAKLIEIIQSKITIQLTNLHNLLNNL